MSRNDHTDRFDLQDRVAVVTGGGGLLGRHMVAGLAAAGAAVAIADVDTSTASAVADDVSKAYGTSTIAAECDVASPASVEGMADQVEKSLGPINVLINNAASKSSSLESFFAPLEEYDPETWREVMETNLDGMFNVAKSLGSRMATRKRGSIVQIASIYGLVSPDPRIYDGSSYLGREINTPPVYSASKAGVIGLTRHLAVHWAPSGVRVNCISPGGVASGQNDTFERKYSERVPMGRMATPADIVGTTVFLASDASSYITGQNIVVDGGLSVW